MPESWASVDLHLDWTPTRRPAQTLGDALRAAIRAGQLPPGAALPSTRALAGDLGVARGTVSSVYADLAAEGYLWIRHGAPTRVAAGVFAHVRAAGPAATAGDPRRVGRSVRASLTSAPSPGRHGRQPPAG
ncbi:MAG TPA: winged helix-turn-helix domain-containing protein [Jatrophihabitantaceae bacterium]|nr:winged helix-turn-helix domain-containing protein [Jatrophihabitantaceae bacterium]